MTRLVSLFALVATLLQFHSPPVLAAEISACVRSNGSMVLIGPQYRRQSCRASETALTFNTEGPQGLPGPTGPQGPTGEQGLPAQQGAGNIAFFNDFSAGRVLTTSGEVWRFDFSSQLWVRDAPGPGAWVPDPPVPPSSIVAYALGSFLDTNGDVWSLTSGCTPPTCPWTNRGHP